jgi:predicted rRNA methylase YqxC with S4 and FtsJ domains
VLRQVAADAVSWEAEVVGVTDSGLPGPKGNHEFFLHLVNRAGAVPPEQLEEWIDDAVG